MRLSRQVGTRYAWLSLSLSQVLANRDALLQLCADGDLVIPQSNALDVLLGDSTLPVLCAVTVTYSVFVAAQLLKKCKRGEGELVGLLA